MKHLPKISQKLIPIAIAGFSLILLFAAMTELKYGLSLTQYLRYSMPLSASETAYLQSHEGFRYGFDQNAPPLSFTNESGQNEGLIVDYLSSLSIELGIPIKCEPLVWSRLIEALKSDEIDATDLFPSDSRKQYFDFTQEIYTLQGTLAVPSSQSGIRSGADLAGKRIAVPAEDYAEEYLQSIYDGQPLKPAIIPVSDLHEALLLLQNGQADAVAGDASVMDYTLQSLAQSTASEIKIQLIEKPLYNKAVTFAVKKGNRELLSILNKGILHLKKKDILSKTQEKWFHVSAPIVRGGSSYALISRIAFAGILLLLLFYYWNDIMRHKIKEKTREIEISKENLREIIDALHVALFVLDKDLHIVECNAAADYFLKKEHGSIVQSTVTQHPLLAALYARRQDNPPCHIDDSYYSMVIRRLESVPGNQLLTVEDVTEKILSERQLRQQGKMIAIGQLTAGLAHEIRNPLGLIKNYLYVLRHRAAADQTTIHAIETADDSADRIGSLIENLLNFSRLGGDAEKETDLSLMISGILQLFEKKITEKRVLVEISCNDLSRIFINAESLKLILFNLIDNAIDAFESHSADSDISVNKLSLSVKECRQTLEIQIGDNACGISEENLEHIFNPFFTTKETGTGLGLYIVSFELEKMNGTIFANSRIGEGTVFSVHIPINKC